MHQRLVTSEFAIERVVPFFQPIIDLKYNTVWRYECLARLVTESDHIFLPSEFLYIVDREKANIELTHHIYALGHQYLSSHQMPWSINLSSADLRDENMVDWLVNECKQRDNDLFGIEVSIDDALDSIQVIERLVAQCKNLSISIDDIESADSELEKLLKIGVDALKIRGSVSNNVHDEAARLSQIIPLVALCKRYQTKLVAEHIEDSETLAELSELGIRYGQGFFFNSPAATVS
ncbi:EAL domain-containing protein [Glaciecola sp. KUL10]|uniref:EAL domain-containing protein n=1 Tax=Glaciecola sp. (strain KUL10) TaxID=2161813 RepID=UPI000D7898CB|nr:EAL domain-containing protein [Glaciecola sp. KUL10]GBL05070.1 diguanylate phosphodiesterase [Glaciecola sp. KUL10]